MTRKWNVPAVAGWLLMLACGLVAPLQADDFEREPISYSAAAGDNAITCLQKRIDAGQAKLAWTQEHGYLPALLRELKVSPSTQMLVFSKTSFQRNRISPRTPRALYFNDEVYVGFCQHGDVLEISAVDPQLGAVFYTLPQEQTARPQFTRQTDSCLICHASSQTQGVPGHVVRSVFADSTGLPLLASGTYRITQASALETRWGGWYVTGTHGRQTHLGNLVVRGRTAPRPGEDHHGLNITSLARHCDTSAYLTPHSDLVALLVLEHQAEAHNLLTRASFQT
ncbi:MAG: hypothetical protein L0Z62_45430, partial [Gemmataceae bacterium]|nr:hypothetical protein [Gemmataceae bacterium]